MQVSESSPLFTPPARHRLFQVELTTGELLRRVIPIHAQFLVEDAEMCSRIVGMTTSVVRYPDMETVVDPEPTSLFFGHNFTHDPAWRDLVVHKGKGKRRRLHQVAPRSLLGFNQNTLEVTIAHNAPLPDSYLDCFKTYTPGRVTQQEEKVLRQQADTLKLASTMTVRHYLASQPDLFEQRHDFQEYMTRKDIGSWNPPALRD